MSEVSKIKILGDPLLGCIAEEVVSICDSDIQQLIVTMLDTVKAVGGMGIAAPQLGVSKRILIISSKPNERYPNAPFMDVTIMINPHVISRSKQTNKDWEGCLSIPNRRALVSRHNSIVVEYYSSDNMLHQANLDGFISRIFQHEYDHLEGKLFVDRVESSTDIILESDWLQLIAETYSQSNSKRSIPQ